MIGSGKTGFRVAMLLIAAAVLGGAAGRRLESVSPDDEARSWEQIRGLERLSQVLDQQVQELMMRREAVLQAWPPTSNPASVTLITMIDAQINALYEDSVAAATTARGRKLSSIQGPADEPLTSRTTHPPATGAAAA